MILSHEDARFASNYFRDYFENFERIDEYFRKVKLERMEKIPQPLFGFSIGDDMFSDFSIHPEDMDIHFRLADSRYDDYLEVTASQPVERSTPGRALKLMVFERTTNKIIGFIRLGSCTINSKPRFDYLGDHTYTSTSEGMKRFNDASCMGQIIVPTQPFGFNYLGGKLLAAICCTHEARELFSEKYSCNICFFETTSLYGSSKAASQYDGMKPLLRFQGLSVSNFTPLLNDEKFGFLNQWFVARNGNEQLKHRDSDVKGSKQLTMISITKNSLRQYSQSEYESFCSLIDHAKSLTEKKRTFISDYGFANTADYVLGRTDTLVRGQNFDKHYLANVVSWWKKQAGKRYEKLKSENRLRTELELWNENSNIDIIR
jgi:hypothetical protein